MDIIIFIENLQIVTKDLFIYYIGKILKCACWRKKC